ncbi:MAG: glycosyltransferase [Planctomycetota bacterium]
MSGKARRYLEKLAIPATKIRRQLDTLYRVANSETGDPLSCEPSTVFVPPKPELFLAWYYNQTYPGVVPAGESAWSHFCRIGWRKGLNPHPLFFTNYYRKNYLAELPNENPLLHYLSNPDCLHSTHPLFDPKYFTAQLTAEQKQAKQNQTWLEFFLDGHGVKSASPSPRFSIRGYNELYPDIEHNNLNALYHYVLHGQKNGRQIVPVRPTARSLFDEEYYRATNPDVIVDDYWTHYRTVGFKENRNPNPLFHLQYYTDLNLDGSVDTDPLEHYVNQVACPVNTHPLFDAEFYLRQIGSTTNQLYRFGLTPLHHVLMHNRENLASPSPYFSSEKYLEAYPDLEACPKLNPIYNYLVSGIEGGRVPYIDASNLDRIREYGTREYELLYRYLETPHCRFITSFALASRRKTILMVSDDCSASLASKTAIKTQKRLSDRYGVEIVNLVFRGGSDSPEFEQIGPLLNLQGSRQTYKTDQFRYAFDLLKQLIPTRDWVGVLVNSKEPEGWLPELHQLELPIQTHIRGDLDLSSDQAVSCIHNLSDQVVFPVGSSAKLGSYSDLVADANISAIPFGIPQSTIAFDEEFASRLRQKLQLPSDAILVVGSGPLSKESGFDWFLNTANSAINQRDPSRPPLSFVWAKCDSFCHNESTELRWIQHDLEKMNLNESIRVVGREVDASELIAGCDIYFNSDRADQLTDAVRYAMAAAKPIVCFDCAKNCLKVLQQEACGIQYGNINQAADSLLQLIETPNLRNNWGSRNHQYAQQNFQLDLYLERTINQFVDIQLRNNCAIGSNSRELNSQLVNQRDSKRKKVIFTLPAWNVSGVNTFVENLIGGLNQNGFDAEILFTNRIAHQESGLDQPKVPFRHLTTRNIDWEKKRQRIFEYVCSNAPCVFVPNYDYIASSISESLPDDVGVLGILHCDDSEHYVHGYQQGPFWDSMVAVSKTIGQKILQLNPNFEEKLSTIRYGVPVPKRLPSRTIRHGRPIRLVYTGRIVQAQKRVMDLVELASELDQGNVPFELTIIGDGENLGELQTLMERWVLQGCVKFLGRCSPQQVQSQLLEHDALVLVSEFEGLPLSILEGMAHGCVPVSTQICSGIDEILIHRTNGLLSSIGDMRQMAANIEQLYRAPEFANELRQAAFRTLFEHHLTANQMTQKYCQLLEQIFARLTAGRKQQSKLLISPEVASMLKAG